MLHANHPEIRELLLKGEFGLEKENLRVDENGCLSHSPDPFPEEEHISRDFCENQVEVNTSVSDSAAGAIRELQIFDSKIKERLNSLPQREYLWPFSSPPYIRSEADIPVAHFIGSEFSKTRYREYLSDRYGRYKMAFCGIHFNYSFAEELLKKDFAVSGEEDFISYKNKLYVTLAERMMAYGWIMVAITAASPLLDSSFVEKGVMGKDLFTGMASVRCSELGYWNFFVPILDYTDVNSYADSIQKYVDDGLISFPSELYYPIRLKPRGQNNLDILREKGVNHIELRMIDLNPLVPGGLEEKDILFAQLLLVWLASTPRQPFERRDQVQAIQNFKNAAHFDLKTVKLVVPNGEVYTVAQAGINVINFMEEFYKDFPKEVKDVLAFQKEKFGDIEKRYAWKIREQFRDGFVKKGLELAKRQSEIK